MSLPVAAEGALRRVSPRERKELLDASLARVHAREGILEAVDEFHQADLARGEARLSGGGVLESPATGEAIVWVLRQDRGHHALAREVIAAEVAKALRLSEPERRARVHEILETERHRLRARDALREDRVAEMMRLAA